MIISLKNIYLENKNKFYLVSIFFLLCISKIYFVLNFQGPTILGDEVLYWDFAKTITHFKIPQYALTRTIPFTYSIFISPAFLTNDPYIFAKIINILISSSIIFPVWFIVKFYIDEKKALLLTIITALQPFSFEYPKYLMTENLFFPVFLFTIYYFIKAKDTLNYKTTIIYTLFLLLEISIRYLGVVIIPILIILWWLPVVQNENNIKNINKIKVKHFLITIFIFVIPLFFFYLMNMERANIFIFKFFSIGLKVLFQKGRNAPFLFEWSLLYSSYYILSLSLFLFIIFSRPFNFTKNIFKDKNNQFLIIIIFLTLSFSFLPIRNQAFRATYDYYLLARYILFIPLLWIIYFFIKLDEIEKVSVNKKNSVFFLSFSLLVVLILLIFSYSALIKGSVFKIPDWFIINSNGLDAFQFKKAEFLIYYVIVANIVLYLLAKYRRKQIFYFAFWLCVPFYIVSNFIHIFKGEDAIIPTKEIIELAATHRLNSLQVFNATYYNNMYLYFSFWFWNNDKNGKIIALSDIRLYNTKAILLSNKENYNLTISQKENYLGEISIGEKIPDKFNIYRTPFDLTAANKSIFAFASFSPNLLINNFGANRVDFNQNDSLYNLWFIPGKAEKSVKVVLDEFFLVNHEYSDSVITASIPQSLLALTNKNKYALRLYDVEKRIYSGPVFIYIEKYDTKSLPSRLCNFSDSIKINKYGSAMVNLKKSPDSVFNFWFIPTKPDIDLKVVIMERNSNSVDSTRLYVFNIKENLSKETKIYIENNYFKYLKKEIPNYYSSVKTFEPRYISTDEKYFGKYYSSDRFYLGGMFLNTVFGGNVVTASVSRKFLESSKSGKFEFRLFNVSNYTYSEPVALEVIRHTP